MPTVVTRYTLLQRPGTRPGTYQSFELARDTATGTYTLVALDIFSLDRTHFDTGNAGVSVQGTSVIIGGTVNGVEFVAPRALNDFVLSFDLNSPGSAMLDRTAVRLDAGVVTRDTSFIDAAYYDLLGRLPDGGELDYWNPRFGDGRSDTSALRHTIVADPSSGASVRDMVNRLYADFGGRDASAAERDFWAARLADGEHYSGVRMAIIDDPLGRDHIGAVTDAIYREFAGRGTTLAETAFWTGEVRGGTTYSGIRNGVLDDPLGKAHTAAELGTLYGEYFGRNPSASEVAVWDGLLHAGPLQRGYDFDTVEVTLMLDGGSDATVRRLTGTYRPDVFEFGPRIGHVVIYDFDGRVDRITLNGTAFAGLDPFDPARAHVVDQLNGTGRGTLITLSEDDTIYIPIVHLNYATGAGSDGLF